MDKEIQGRNNAPELKRAINIAAAYSMSATDEFVDATTTTAGYDVTLPNAVMCNNGRDYTIRGVALATGKSVTVKSGADSFSTLSQAITATGCYVVVRSNGRMWYVVAEKLS